MDNLSVGDYVTYKKNINGNGGRVLDGQITAIPEKYPSFVEIDNEMIPREVIVKKCEPIYDDWLDFGSVLAAAKNGEYGSAVLFATMFEGRYCYDHTDNQWFVWTGNYWEQDKRNNIVNELVESLSAQFAHADAIAAKRGLKYDNEQRQALYKAIGALRYSNSIGSILRLTKSQPKLSLTGDEWDNDSWILGVANGVIDLKTGNHSEAMPTDFIRTVAPTEWTGLEVPSPKWEKFLTEVFNGDTELIQFVQRVLGHALVGEVIEHVLPILVGESGRNGKSLLLSIIRHVLGDYAGPAAEEILLSGRNSPGASMPFVAALRFKRLVYVNESNEGARLRTATVKQLTGGDELVARNLYGKPFSFMPKHTCLMTTNHKPHAPSDDLAIWERLYLIEFTQRFIDEPTEKNEHKRNPYLFQELQTETSGILSWLIRGCLSWQKQGLNPPQSVKIATEKYRQSEDDLGRFIEEKCLISDNEKVKVKGSVFYQGYKSWSLDEGLKPMTGTKFGARQKKRFSWKKERNGIFYHGVCIQPIINESDAAAIEEAQKMIEKSKEKPKEISLEESFLS